MNILFLTDNFPPESNAPAARTYEHAQRWVKSGHSVTVVTCFPNFPGGVVYEGYKNRWYSSEDVDGIRVIRVKSYMTANEGIIRRTLDYLSFMLTGSIVSCFLKKPDVVVATSPQFFCGVAGMIVGAIRRIPFILEVRDIWPASIVAVGAMQDSLNIRILEKIERLMYRRAQSIVVVTKVFKDEISEKIGCSEKIHIALNGVDTALFYQRDKHSGLVDQHELKGKFVVGYIGTHGLAHDLGNVIDAVEKLRDHKDIVFIFVGAGAERANVENLVREKQLDNVRMITQQPRELMPSYLSICDLMIIPLRDTPLFATVIPSKLFESMAMGVPVLMSLPKGEATDIVEKTGCGVVVPPGDSTAIASAVERLSMDTELLQQYQQAGATAAVKYTRDSSAQIMLSVFTETELHGATTNC